MGKRVFISNAELVRPDGEALLPLDEQEAKVLHKLRSHGIPVQGIRILVGVERGELRIRRRDNGYEYTWSAI